MATFTPDQTIALSIDDSARPIISDDGNVAFVEQYISAVDMDEFVAAATFWVIVFVAILISIIILLRAFFRIRKRPQIVGHPYCGKCNYQLAGGYTRECPECGQALGGHRVMGKVPIKRMVPAFIVVSIIAGLIGGSIMGGMKGVVHHVVNGMMDNTVSVDLYQWADNKGLSWLTDYRTSVAGIAVVDIATGKVESEFEVISKPEMRNWVASSDGSWLLAIDRNKAGMISIHQYTVGGHYKFICEFDSNNQYFRSALAQDNQYLLFFTSSGRGRGHVAVEVDVISGQHRSVSLGSVQINGMYYQTSTRLPLFEVKNETRETIVQMLKRSNGRLTTRKATLQRREKAIGWHVSEDFTRALIIDQNTQGQNFLVEWDLNDGAKPTRIVPLPAVNSHILSSQVVRVGSHYWILLDADVNENLFLWDSEKGEILQEFKVGNRRRVFLIAAKDKMMLHSRGQLEILNAPFVKAGSSR